MKIYRERIAEFEEKYRANRRRDRGFSLARLIVMLAVLVFVYFSIAEKDFGYLLWAGGLLALFLALLWLHNNVRDKSRRLKAFIKINRDELQYLDRDLLAFGDGAEFLDQEHPYSYDLDIFGAHSLFHHINRSATLEGKKVLAEALLSQHHTDIEAKQQAVEELKEDLDFRQEFLVEAGLLEEDAELQSKLRAWKSAKKDQKGLVNKWVLYVLSAIVLGALFYWLLFPSLQTFYTFAALAGINLAVVAARLKSIKRQYDALDGISKSLLMYGKMLLMIEEREHRSMHLKGLKNRLDQSSGKASAALRQLSQILSSFDQLNNPMGSLIMNALFFYHLHALRNLARWKSLYSDKIEGWIAVVAEFDKICSLSNFAYNHPDFIVPQVSDQPLLKAEDAGHPLIDKAKRVTNSIDFAPYQYVVLTGSNMSGKSTFLKTLGVNLVLAKAGAPVCASSMSFFPFTLLSSMKMVDSIHKEESYFQAEIIRLKQLQNTMKSGEACFVLLDEILRGTNSDDKRNGTRLFMQGIAEYNAKGVIATHDIDIADLAQKQKGAFVAKYFESKFKDGELVFDYRLRDGICTTPNATELMRLHGIIK